MGGVPRTISTHEPIHEVFISAYSFQISFKILQNGALVIIAIWVELAYFVSYHLACYPNPKPNPNPDPNSNPNPRWAFSQNVQTLPI